MARIGPRLTGYVFRQSASWAFAWPRVGAGHLFVVLTFLIGFGGFPLGVVGPDLGYLPGDVVDNRFNNYVLEHGYRWLTGREPSFWHAPFCYPARWTIARSDTHLGNLPLYSAYRIAGAGPERAFQFWWLTTFGLNFAAAIWAARRLGIGWIGAAVAAYIFTFGLPVAASLPHAQLAPRYFVPPAVAFTGIFLFHPSWRYLLRAAACLVAQLYCTVYIGFFLALLLAAVVVAAAICYRRELPWNALLFPSRRECAARIAILAVTVAALVPLIRPHRIAAKDSHPVSPTIILQLTPKPVDWVRPAPQSVTWAWLLPITGDPWERHLFNLFPGGLAVLGLVAEIGWLVAAARSSQFRQSSTVRLAAGLAVAVLLVLVVVLRVEGWCPYRYLLDLPGVAGIRAVFRVGLVLLFPLGLLAGVVASGVVSTGEKIGGWLGRMLASAVVLLALVADHQVDPPKTDAGGIGRYAIAEAVARREALTAAVRETGQPTAFYVFPGRERVGTQALAVHIDAMWASLDTGVPTVNGYTGHSPKKYFPFDNFAGVFHWLRIRNALTAELLDGFIAFGEPFGREDFPAECELHAMFPPRPLPSVIP